MPIHAHASNGPAWLDAGLVETPSLNADAECDVCIVGAGIAGLLTAERLASDGLRVVVLDRGPVGGGETSRTTAHVVNALDERYTELRLLHGHRGARLAAESHAAAVEHIESLGGRLNLEFGWRRLDGYLVVNERHEKDRGSLLGDELEAAREAGVDVERVEGLPSPWPGSYGAALRFRRQGQMHPLRLMTGVARHLVERGVRVHTGTNATEVRGGAEAAVETAAGPVVRCRHVVVATNTPFNNRVVMHTKQAGYQTYVVAFRVPAGLLPPLLFWDGVWKNDLSYHYVRLYERGAAGGEDLLIVGGEDHKTGQGPDGAEPYRCLEEWTRTRFPMCGPVEYRWSGEVMEPADGLGYIGRDPVGPENVYIVTGDSGNGTTHGAIAALLIPELIVGREHPWATLYDPARKVGLHGLRDYAKENANTLAQYGDWLRRGDVESEDEIPPGEGAVIVNGLKRLAVYKDAAGRCTRMNAMCTHLGAAVRWNSQEKTWDCPAHGSRFDCAGRTIHGPANSDLRPDEAGAGEPAAPAGAERGSAR